MGRVIRAIAKRISILHVREARAFGAFEVSASSHSEWTSATWNLFRNWSRSFAEWYRLFGEEMNRWPTNIFWILNRNGRENYSRPFFAR